MLGSGSQSMSGWRTSGCWRKPDPAALCKAVVEPGTPESSSSHASALWPCQEAEGPMNYEHCLPRPPYFCLAELRRMQEASFELPVVYTAHQCAQPAERSDLCCQHTPLPLLLGAQLPTASIVPEAFSLCTSHPGFWADPPFSLPHLYFRSSLQLLRSMTDLGTPPLFTCLIPCHSEIPGASLLRMFPSCYLLNQKQQEHLWVLNQSASIQSLKSLTLSPSRGFKALPLSKVASRTAPGTDFTPAFLQS